MTAPSTESGGPGPRGWALFLRYWLPVLVYIALIFSGSSVKGADLPSLYPYMDKIAHLLEYSLLGLLLGRAVRATMAGWSTVILTFVTVGCGGMIGLVDELYQRSVPGRQSDPLDWLTDVTAIAAAILLAQVLHLRPLSGGGPSPKDSSR